MSPGRVAVLGAGAWGTALALQARRAGHEVRLWARDRSTVKEISAGENRRYLPGTAIDRSIRASADAGAVLDRADIVFAAVPAQHLREALEGIAGDVPPNATLVLCAKGIEAASGRLLSEVLRGLFPKNPVAALSGPSFAADVARRLPTAVVIAHSEVESAAALAGKLSTAEFRCYSTDDLTGVQVGGALKNVLAIGAGAVSGAALGASAQAAMVTRGFVELRRFAAALGARAETMMGLSGLGDLLLTCASAQSRNFAYGVALGEGRRLAGLPLAEGVATARIAARIAQERGIEAPIMAAIEAVLAGSLQIGHAVEQLMSRPLRSEGE